MLRLTALDSEGMSQETRDAFVNMAENLGINPGEAEKLVDLYLDEADKTSQGSAAIPTAKATPEPILASSLASKVVDTPSAPAAKGELPAFASSIGAQMLYGPGGAFVMGSDEMDAGPNERPMTKIKLTGYYMSRFPITNVEYEQFDPGHARKRSPQAGDLHPVVYVSSLEAVKFCQWLSTRERRKYRLPTEAEWEFAARGTDGRRFPWGNQEKSGNLGNFADKNTVFAWSDREINDGYPESSPVGAFPLGVSPFGMEDMAGNVWEWCLDFFETYRGSPRADPRGATSGAKRVYRGGSWKSRFHSLRATTRGFNALNYSCNDLGFRILCEWA
jgi:formylglycine-generating enzyme required for sulfatase activity